MTGTINANETLNGGVEAIPTLSGTLSGNTTSSYNSLSDKPIINGTTLEGGVDRSLIEDVKVNGVSVVNEEYIAEIENSAEDVPYDNSDSHTQSTDVQDALDEAFERTVVLANGLTSAFNDVAENYTSAQHNYTKGDYVLYETKLYRCIENTSGAWDSTKWEEVKLSNEVSDEITLREELESATKVYGTPKNLPQPIATFTDGSNLPMPSLKTTIVPIQSGSGDPSPTNIRPISGWSGENVSVTGKNKWSYGDISVNTNETKNIYLKKGNYTFSAKVTTDATPTSCLIRVTYTDNTGANINYIVGDNTRRSASLNLSQDIKSITLYSSDTYGHSTGKIATYENIQIELGSATEYEPYNGHTYTIQFTDSQGNPIEVFGGEVDVVNGSLDENQFCYKITSDTIISKSGDYFEINNVLDDDATANYEFLSSFCKRTTTSLSNMSDNEGRFVTNRRYLAVKLPYSTVEEVKTYLTSINAQIVYKLPSSTTLQQQSTSIKSLEGNNNVWGDCGSIKDLKYTRNLNITINDILSRLDALEG